MVKKSIIFVLVLNMSSSSFIARPVDHRARQALGLVAFLFAVATFVATCPSKMDRSAEN